MTKKQTASLVSKPRFVALKLVNIFQNINMTFKSADITIGNHIH